MQNVTLSKAEMRVLEALWEEQPLTVGQLIERIRRHTDWHDNTVKTLLTRLVDKKAVARRKDGGRFFYRPLVAREAVLEKESDRLLDRFFGGRLAPLIAHFADKRKLSKSDIEQIEKILADLKDRDA